MSTKRAMEYLQGLIELDQRAGMQMSALAATLKQVIAQMNAILEDADQSVSETLTELTTGLEPKFTLKRDPVKVGSIKLYLNSTVVATAGYTVLGNVITPVSTIPAGKILRAEYKVLGLKTQTTELLAVMDDLKAMYFTTRMAKYTQAVAWLDSL